MLSHKQTAFIAEYLKDFNATQAAVRAGYSAKTAYSIGQENLTKPEIKAAIRAALDERVMSADEVMVRLSEQARADLGQFFRLVEEWTFYPLPSYEVLGEKLVAETNEDGEPTGKTKISYWVRHVVLDMDKLLDPRFSHLLHKFSDSPKNGLSVELHNKQTALQTLAKIHGLMIDKTETKLTGEVTVNWNIPVPPNSSL